jgi:hypothetical protein
MLFPLRLSRNDWVYDECMKGCFDYFESLKRYDYQIRKMMKCSFWFDLSANPKIGKM